MAQQAQHARYRQVSPIDALDLPLATWKLCRSSDDSRSLYLYGALSWQSPAKNVFSLPSAPGNALALTPGPLALSTDHCRPYLGSRS